MKIAIIDDHPLVRHGLASILALEKDIDNDVLQADTVESGIRLMKEQNLDIALIDIKLGDENGLEIVKQARQENCEAKLVVLTSSPRSDIFLKAVRYEIDGYLLKESLPEEILFALRMILKGRKYYDPALVSYKMTSLETLAMNPLTTREREVLDALGMGLTNQQIAKKLFISEHTVKKHVGQILSKLNLHDRTQAALYANNQGIVNL